MGSWQVRLAINTAKAALPFQRQLRALKRNARPSTLGFHHQRVIEGALRQIAALRRAGVSLTGARVLEVGSGWHPIAPLVFRAAGAAKLYLTDSHYLLHERSIREAALFVASRAKQISSELDIPEAEIEASLTPMAGADFDGLMAQYGFQYVVPFDAGMIDPVEVIFSHTVLEHISEVQLQEMFLSFKSLLAPGGVMSHGVDHSDHRCHLDNSLSRIDFLRYSDKIWQLMCANPQDYTNRLRHSDYLALLENSGYLIIHEYKWVCPQSLAILPKVPLAQKFTNKSPDDLCTTWSYMLAAPSA